MQQPQELTARQRALHLLTVAGGSAVLTVACFLVLPFFQALAAQERDRLFVREIDSGALPPPPPPPPEPEPEPESEPEPPPEPMQPDMPNLDLTQLDLSLNAGGSGGWLQGPGGLDISSLQVAGKSGEDLFSIADLDQRPRPRYQAPMRLDDSVKRHTPGKVWIDCVVDTDGSVVDPSIHKSTHPGLEKCALEAFRKWRFEPGKRNGTAVRFRIRQPITFPKM